MVFCYKFVTESPRRYGSVSPRRRSPVRFEEYNRICPRTMSTLINTVDYEAEFKGSSFPRLKTNVSIPEHDWKLLNILARKREETFERERLAEDFRNLWYKENEERKQVETELSKQYNKYLRVKRDEERQAFEERQLRRLTDERQQRCDLINSIKCKELRSADTLARVDDIKTSGLMEKSLIEECRYTLAARRRARQNAVDNFKRRVDMNTSLRKCYDAEKRRVAKLHDDAKRVAISNAFSTWETSFARHELQAVDAAKRASLIQQLAYEDKRSNTFLRKRDRQWNHQRKMAAISAKLRDAIREHKF